MSHLLKIGVGEMAISSNPEETLYTSSLGSCVALCAYNAQQQIGGLAHIQLPNSQIHSSDAMRKKDPRKSACFADLALPALFNKLDQQLSQQSSQHSYHNTTFILSLIGGAHLHHGTGADFFNIGTLNIAAVKKIIHNLGMSFAHADLGGQRPRSVYMQIQNGSIKITSLAQTYFLENQP